MPLLAGGEQASPIYELLRELPSNRVTEQVTVYAAAQSTKIPCEALAHFALGIFWKASVHHWHGGDTDLQINLGPYEEKIRRFVREPEKVLFPENVALMIIVLPPIRVPLLLSIPVEAPRGDGYRNFRFYVPGVQFVLSVGKSVEREVCFKTNPLRPIFVQDIEGAVNAIPRRMFLNGKAMNEFERRAFGNVLSSKQRKPRR